MNVLIIEDDPMVEFIHRNYLEKGGQFDNIYSANSLKDAKELLEKCEVALILLDVQLKDGSGLDLLSELRKCHSNSDVILITAANEAQTVKEGLRLGVIDYLIKPFTNQRFQQSINLFIRQITNLNKETVEQAQIDRLMNSSKAEQSQAAAELDKGLSVETLQKIKRTIRGMAAPFTIQELADSCQISHVTIRKYVAYLEEHTYLNSRVIYTKVGRPYKIFERKK
ncbi:response regulator [Streptococcus devriesei]|uniref:response regulator n=1 Tax=Streptococcus devriesei TaxID=231233 RepID=UPI00041F192F|nr:response regulator [Streptococcus devriesei]